MKRQNSISWKTALLFSGALYLLATSSAYADVYNLYFKKSGPTDTTPEETAVEPKPPVQTQPITPQPQPQPQPAPTTQSDQSKVIIPQTDGKTPTTIIINNNLNAPQTPAVLPVITPPSPSPILREETFEHIINPEARRRSSLDLSPKRHPFKAIVGASYFAEHSHDFSDSRYYSLTSSDGFGLTASLGIDIVPALGVYVWGGVAPSLGSTAKFYGGGDLQIMPVRINVGTHDLIELGVLAGASTLTGYSASFGPFHAGARLNLNFNDSMGITTALRINSNYFMAEAGFIAAL